MERTSQVILRNGSRLGEDRLLLVNPPRDALCQQLRSERHLLRISTQDHGDYRWLSAVNDSIAFELLPVFDEPCQTIIFWLPREKDRLQMMLHALSCRMQEESRLWLVGENQAGVKSAGKYLSQHFTKVTRLDNARHCGLFEATGPVSKETFDLRDYQQSWMVEYSGARIEAVSLPGVFAHGRLDEGSRLLLETMQNLQPAGRVLDFACGSGVIGCALLAAGVKAEMTLLDVSALAIESSRLTLERNGLSASLLASDGLNEASGKYDWIVSNPPFHRGVSNDLNIAGRFFREAGTFLAENGRIVIVCNRHLPYTGWLQNHFDQVERLAENDQFMIIRAGKPRKQKE